MVQLLARCCCPLAIYVLQTSIRLTGLVYFHPRGAKLIVVSWFPTCHMRLILSRVARVVGGDCHARRTLSGNTPSGIYVIVRVWYWWAEEGVECLQRLPWCFCFGCSMLILASQNKIIPLSPLTYYGNGVMSPTDIASLWVFPSCLDEALSTHTFIAISTPRLSRSCPDPVRSESLGPRQSRRDRNRRSRRSPCPTRSSATRTTIQTRCRWAFPVTTARKQALNTGTFLWSGR